PLLEDHEEHRDVDHEDDRARNDTGALGPANGQRLQYPRYNQRCQQGQVLPLSESSYHTPCSARERVPTSDDSPGRYRLAYKMSPVLRGSLLSRFRGQLI